MQVVQIIADEVVQRGIRVPWVGGSQRLVEAHLPEHAAKVFDVVLLLQAVQLVQHQAELVVAEIGQRLAALGGLSLIVQLAQGLDLPCVAVPQVVAVGQYQILAVEQRALIKHRREDEVAGGLQRDVAPPILEDQIDVVILQIQHHHVAVAVKGGQRIPLEEFCLTGIAEARKGQQVQQGGVRGVLQESVVVVEGNGVLVKIDPHIVSVFPHQGDGGSLRLVGELVSLLFAALMLDQVQEISQLLHVQPGQVVHIVKEKQRLRVFKGRIHIADVYLIFDLVKPGRLLCTGDGQRSGQQAERQNHRQQLFHIQASFFSSLFAKYRTFLRACF